MKIIRSAIVTDKVYTFLRHTEYLQNIFHHTLNFRLKNKLHAKVTPLNVDTLSQEILNNFVEVTKVA